MHKLMHVGFSFPGVTKMRDLEPLFNHLDDDWIRYSATTWLIWTEKPAPLIYAVLSKGLDSQDQVMIAPLTVNEGFGNLKPWIWEWLQSKTHSVDHSDKAKNEALRYIEQRNKLLELKKD